MARITKDADRSGSAPRDRVHVRVAHQPFGSDFAREELDALSQVMQQDRMTEGPQNEAFEEEFARSCGVPHAFAIANGSVGLLMAAQLCELRAGDEVITTPLTFISTGTAILACGATPVFADIDPQTFTIDPTSVAERLTPRTRAVFVVHLFGQCCDMDAINAIAAARGLRVIEDAAHVTGATYKGRPAGSLGDAGVFSFHSRKNISTLGEGGMLTTRHAEWAARIPLLRSIGINYAIARDDPDDYWLPLPYDVDAPDGYIPNNYRMNEAQAAVGRVQLRKVAALNQRRREVARRYTEALTGLQGVRTPHEARDGEHIYYLYTLLVDKVEAGFTRDDLMRTLFREFGVQTLTGYPPIYWFKIFRDRGYRAGLCPVTEHVYRRIISLPLYARMTDDDVNYVIAGVQGAVDRLRGRRDPS